MCGRLLTAALLLLVGSSSAGLLRRVEDLSVRHHRHGGEHHHSEKRHQQHQQHQQHHMLNSALLGGGRQQLLGGLHFKSTTAVKAEAKAVAKQGAAAGAAVPTLVGEVLEGEAAAHLLSHQVSVKVAKSQNYLQNLKHVCDGEGEERIVDTSSLKYTRAPPGIRLNETSQDWQDLAAFCKEQCNTDATCSCFNIENSTCAIQTGILKLTKAIDADAFVRVVPTKVSYINPGIKTPSGVAVVEEQHYAVVPGGKCHVAGGGTAGKGGVGGNRTGETIIDAYNITGCQEDCAQQGCSCVNFAEKATSADPAVAAGFTCGMFFGKMGTDIYYDVAHRDPNKRAITAVAVSPGKLSGTVEAAAKQAGPSAGEVAGQIAIVATPVILSLIILWICFGGPIYSLVRESIRKHKGEGKKLEEMSLAERKAHHNTMRSMSSLSEALAHNPSLFLRYRRHAANFMGTKREDDGIVHFPQYDFPEGGEVDYRREVEWKTVWFKRFAHFFSLGGTAIRKCVRPALLVGSLAALWAWAEAVIFFQPEADEHQSPTVEKFRAHMAGISALHDHLVTPATFVVMFSLNEALNRWQNTLTTMWALQDPIQATGFMLGSGFCRAPLKLRPLAFKVRMRK
eukprot:g1313.t1